MKKIFTFAAALLVVFNTWSATGTKDDPIPLTDGNITVDFGSGQSMYYSYTPATDQMLTLSALDNVNFYGQQITSDKSFYYESFNSVRYIQTQAGSRCLIEITKGWGAGASTFTFGHYDCTFPNGDNWDSAIVPFDNYTYVPITGSLPSCLRYTAPADGLLEMRFSSYVSLSCAEAQDGTFTDVKTSYESGGYAGTMNVEAGKTYYFKLSAYGSPLCLFNLIEVKEGESPYTPYILENGSKGVFPKAAGKYYYQINNDKVSTMLTIKGNEPFLGTAQFGDSFTYFRIETKNSINIRTDVSQYYSLYYLVLTRDVDATADQEFTVNFTAAPYDGFPGETITEGATTLPDAPGKFYYTFTVPTDGRNLINVTQATKTADGEQPKSKVSLYYADNKYSALVSGTSINKYRAVAGRQYSLAWDVDAEESPLTFDLEFVAPPQGESQDNPIPAKLGENTAEGGHPTYFLYKSTVDGWLVIKPADGLGTPSISMMPTETDPYMQACDIIADGDGSYRVAAQENRGYMIIFNSEGEIKFTIAELTALPGEAATNPFVMTGDTAYLPKAAAVYWYSYTAPRDGKLVISTDIPYQQTVNHQDYTYVQIYAPTDPDNRIAQLRPDYDMGIFADKILDTTEGTQYLIKVRTLVDADDMWVKCVVRDPIEGEVPEKPIEIPFNGVSGEYNFDRMVNYEADAIWYAIDLHEGYFTLKTISGGAFDLALYAPDNFETPLAKTEALAVDYDEENEMYIYLWGINEYHVEKAGKYLLKLSDNEVPVTATLDMATTGVENIAEGEAAVVPACGGVVLMAGQSTAARIYSVDGKLVKSVQTAASTFVELPAGIYIVYMGTKTAKVMVK